jgi:hypothetical protein
VSEAVGEDMANVVVSEPVVHRAAPLCACHDIAVAEEAKLVAECRLADPQQERKVRHALLIRKAEGVDDPGSCRICQDGKCGRHAIGRRVVEDPAEDLIDVLWVKVSAVSSRRGFM